MKRTGFIEGIGCFTIAYVVSYTIVIFLIFLALITVAYKAIDKIEAQGGLAPSIGKFIGEVQTGIDSVETSATGQE